MRTSSFKHLTLRRKAALVFALVWLPVFGALFLPAALRLPTANWSAFYTVFGGAYSAVAMSVIATEIMRVAAPSLGIHNDATHFRCVAITTVVLLAAGVCAYLIAVAG